MAEPTAVRDEAELRELFAAELRVAGLIAIPSADRDRLYEMWCDHLPLRDALRAAAPLPDEEPTFLEKPTTWPGRSV